jgi:hypothetical protein
MDRSRRAIDAMLCVLNFTLIAPTADLLFLSAMMKNCEEIASWLSSLTGRQCLSLDLTWKPTRQARGCVVYSETEIVTLKIRLREVRQQVTNKNAPASLERSLTVQPFAFFCLHQTWQSQDRNDYSLLPLLEEPVTLSTGTDSNRQWYLTPNGNKVAGKIAEATSKKKLKTLVFTQTIPLANSMVNSLCESLGANDSYLTEEEAQLFSRCVDEFGGKEYLYLMVGEENRLVSSSACHHGLLLPSERSLHESIFKRPNGIHVLVATSTLAQGMNLPSEVVIIAGDSRFDAGAERIEKLEAHELLNAAGRAGRAGESSHGMVLIVPSKVVHFNNETNNIHSHWVDLRTIFAQSDQCLTIDDPISAILDEIHNTVEAHSPIAMYFLRRLPVDERSNIDDSDLQSRNLLSRSFAAFRARIRGDQTWLATRLEAVLIARRNYSDPSQILTWADRLASTVGLPVSFIRDLGLPLSGAIRTEASVVDWRDWLEQWLIERPSLLPMLIRRESLEDLFGTRYKNLLDDEQRGRHVAPIIFELLRLWMSGSAISTIEASFGSESPLGKCEKARKFVLRILPELSYIFSLPSLILRAINADRGIQHEPPLALDKLSICIRDGFDTIEKLALRSYLREHQSRRSIHREFATIQMYMGPRAIGEEFIGTTNRIQNAIFSRNLQQAQNGT